MIQVVYEDEYIIAVNKPNNMVVHHAKHSRNVIDETSLLQCVADEAGLKTHPIHRLDRKTSGVILLAKKSSFVADFQQLFTSNQIEKTYFGIVRGFAPETKIIESPVKGRDAKVHKNALTQVKLIDKITLPIPVKPYDSSRYSLVELQPKTGRMHQLRIHMNKISHPLIGDSKYGDKNHNLMFQQEFNCANLFLHAGFLQFMHPYQNKKMNLKATFPIDWETVFEKFRWKKPI